MENTASGSMVWKWVADILRADAGVQRAGMGELENENARDATGPGPPFAPTCFDEPQRQTLWMFCFLLLFARYLIQP
jgi:hypothetical protein